MNKLDFNAESYVHLASSLPLHMSHIVPSHSHRDEWISQLVDELDSGADSYEYVKHLTDVHRLHLFDAVMQYRAIFFDTPQAGASAQVGSGFRPQAARGVRV